ncbi:alpha/beta fold hydrolase [Pantoea sp. 9140]|uniref:alpha/beta hydrolase n=1 Tax=Pantoea sp. 9140 TaxID=1500896 RepID=UPI000534E9A3|nr:alpha/beta fold hydrolase [Pantoea sp. 9140]
MIDFDQFNQQADRLDATVPQPERVNTAQMDGLRYRLYPPRHATQDVIIVYHGGGVHLDAGYDILARQLSQGDTTAVCLVDIRGHGGSPGAKGQVARPDLVWLDVDTVLAGLRAFFPQARLHLLGHSSGGGMLINYFTRHHPQYPADSLILMAPELGPFAREVRRSGVAVPFARVRQWPFVINALSGGLLFGNYPAVTLNFPPEVKATEPDFVQHYSVNMANALTPRYPAKQLAALPLPVLLLAAENDELFSADAMREFAEKHGNPALRFGVIANSTHLDCLFFASQAIRQHLSLTRQAAR